MCEIVYYGAEDLEVWKDAVGWSCALSNTYCIKPYHCLTGGIDTGEFALPSADIAVVKSNRSGVNGMTPCKVHGSFNFRASDDDEELDSPVHINDFLATFTLRESVYPGDSGIVIYHQGECTKEYPEGPRFVAKVPMYMIIARHNTDDKKVLALNLPYLLLQIRKIDIVINESVLGMTSDFLSNWELISKAAEVQIAVDREVAELGPEAAEEKFITLLNSASLFDKEFLNKLHEQIKSSEKGGVGKNIVREIALYNAFVVALREGEGEFRDDKCWIVQADRAKCTSRDTAYYRKVLDMMTLFQMSNIKDAGQQPDTDKVLYFGSTRPITVNIEAYDLWNEKLLLKLQKPTATKTSSSKKRCVSEYKLQTVCHHPFLCERNPADKCTTGITDNIKDRIIARNGIINHCCMRPSHLVALNERFNGLCTDVLQDKGSQQTGAIAISVKW